jgi:hypothetical protein
MTEKRTILIKSCGHEEDVTTWAELSRPAVGEEVPCWSSCDWVATWRGAGNPHVRKVRRYETRNA